jgi:hypothetical protein
MRMHCENAANMQRKQNRIASESVAKALEKRRQSKSGAFAQQNQN